jgi:DNA-binding beta-propeller fold protein YncE
VLNISSRILLHLIVLGLIVVSGCERKFNIGVLPDPGQATAIGDTNYVEVFPPFGGFQDPGAITVGNDQLIYVADYASNEIVMMDAGGTILMRRGIPHPASIVQNSKLDLYVGGEAIAPNGVDTLGAIYRLFLVRFDTTYVARIDTLVNPSTGDTTITVVRRDTSYFYNHDLEHAHMRIAWQEPGRPQRRYPGIGILPGNGYLVARTGPDNSSFVDPDARVLLFNKGDTLVTPLGDLITRPSGGTAVTDIRDPGSLLVIPSSRDFIMTQNSTATSGIAYGAIWMIYQSTPDFQGWIPKFDPSRPEQRGADFVRPYRFQLATGIAYDRRRREFFVVDSELDSVIKFDRNGRFRTESFGRYKTTSDQLQGLDHPRGIAFSNDCTLYVTDTGHKVIRRFRLSTQTTCN